MSGNVMHLAAGTLLANGKYRIVRFIGAGGFGCTYEAEFVAMGSRVAIKEFFVSSYCNRDSTGTVSVGIASQASLVSKLEEKFKREAQRLFKLKHPGIVSVTDILQENGTSYYVMDYIEGRSLQNVINDEDPLPEARAVKYVRQVMDALEYVHGKSMLHLDIKPDNIMIDAETDHAILIDFGVSKQYDEADGHNTSTLMGYTPGFAAPEQVGNSIRQFTPAADIYALGATLYAALTGCVPPSSPDLISGVAQLQPLPAATSAETRRAISTMMQPNVAMRPQTISAARALLSGMENGEFKIENKPGTPTNVGSRSVETAPIDPTPKSKKWLWITIAAVAIVIGVVAVFLSRNLSEKSELSEPSEANEIVEVTDSIDDSYASDNSDTSDDSDVTDNVEEPLPGESTAPIDETEAPSVEPQQVPQAEMQTPPQATPQAEQTPPQPQQPQPQQTQTQAPTQQTGPAGSATINAEGVYLTCIYKPTGKQRFFTRNEWNALSSSSKSDYIKLGVALFAEGHKFIVAKAEATSDGVEWGPEEDVKSLRNICERS